MLDTLKDRPINIKGLVLESPKEMVAKFDPRIEVTQPLVNAIKTEVIDTSKGHSVYTLQSAAKLAIIAAGAGLESPLDQDFVNRYYEIYTKREGITHKLRFGSPLKIISPGLKVDYFDHNPEDLNFYWDELDSYVRGFNRGRVSLLEDLLGEVTCFKILYPQHPLKINPGSDFWSYAFSHLRGLVQETKEEDVASKVTLASTLSDLRWGFPERFSEFPIDDQLWGYWNRRQKQFKNTGNLAGFNHLASALTIISADEIGFDGQNLKIVFPPTHFNQQVSDMPKRRRF